MRKPYRLGHPVRRSEHGARIIACRSGKLVEQVLCAVVHANLKLVYWAVGCDPDVGFVLLVLDHVDAAPSAYEAGGGNG